MPTLILKYRDQTLANHQLQRGLSLTIGRRKNNDVVVEDLAVSGHHAKIDSVGESFVLIDLRSRNGSFVNEQLVHSHWLKHGDVINIGEHSLVFNNSEEGRATDDEFDALDTTMIMDSSQYRSMMQRSHPTRSINVVRFWDKSPDRTKVKNKKSKPQVSTCIPTSNENKTGGVLTYLSGGSGKIKLARKITTIGKHPTSDIVVKGWFIGPTAATISKKPDGFYICHVGGLSKPKINEKPVKQWTILNDSDIIEVGSTKLRFSDENSKNNKEEAEEHSTLDNMN